MRFPLLVSSHVHLCEVGGHVVLLDLRRDKYYAIGSVEAESLVGRVEGWGDVFAVGSSATEQTEFAEGDLVHSMLADRLLTSDPMAGKRAVCEVVEPVTAELVDDDEGEVALRARHFRTVGSSVTRAWLAIKLLPFESVVQSVRKRKLRALSRGQVDYSLANDRELVAIFNRLRPFFFTQRDKCLFDSLALIEFLAAHKRYPTWVLGVATNPFTAHSWVQAHGLLFNGPMALRLAVTPILAI